MFDWFDARSVADLLEAYGLYADIPTNMLEPFLVEKIAGDDRLRNLDENRRATVLNANLVILEQMIEALDRAQDKYEDTVSLPWLGFDHVLLALFLHYATVRAIIGHAAPDALDVSKHMMRAWRIDYRHLHEWSKSNAQETDAQKANRAKLYTGNSRGTAFHQVEVGTLKRYTAGWVSLYQTKDSKACSSCHDAAGYYLIGRGPYPGQVCKGRARCRCKRLIVWNPAQHKILSGAIDVTAGHRW